MLGTGEPKVVSTPSNSKVDAVRAGHTVPLLVLNPTTTLRTDSFLLSPSSNSLPALLLQTPVAVEVTST